MNKGILSEFEFLIEEEVIDYEQVSKELVAKAKGIGGVKTLNGIKVENIVKHMKFNETANMPWSHVTLSITPDLFDDMNNERISDLVVFDFVEEIESNLNDKLGVANNSYRNKVKYLVFPSSIKVIGSWAFSYYKNLKTIKFETNSGLRCFGQGAFANCRELKTLDLGECNKLEIIPNYAVYGSAVSQLILPLSIKQVMPKAFDKSSIKHIIIGNERYEIDDFIERLTYNNFEAFWGDITGYEF